MSMKLWELEHSIALRPDAIGAHYNLAMAYLQRTALTGEIEKLRKLIESSQSLLTLTIPL